MDTAMQELIDLIYAGKLQSKLDILAQAHILKKKERFQIENAYDCAIDLNQKPDGQDYYEETYKQW
tara:strand:+ start:359 stop:556 length:198 start_codon:yes stop_codon:yes gene_type:complete